MNAPVIIVTVLGREGDLITSLHGDIVWSEKPSKQAIAVSRAAPLTGMSKVEAKGVKSWVVPVDGGSALYVSENFEAICNALDAKAVTG